MYLKVFTVDHIARQENKFLYGSMIRKRLSIKLNCVISQNRLLLMNMIVENVPRIKWYTDLYPFVISLGDVIDEFVWRFDDVESFAPFPPASESGVWHLSGKELRTLISDHPQFTWAVISAIPCRFANKMQKIQTQPYADGNPTFWLGSPKPQHPNAAFEIVCWDSSATMVIGADENIASAFLKAYPEAIDLDRENRKHLRK